MKTFLTLFVLFLFSFTQAKAICMSDDDLMDYAIMSYMETSWATMEACIERVSDYDYMIYDKFYKQFEKVKKTSNGYVDEYFKSLYGTDIIAKKKKKENIELIVNSFKANVIDKMDIKELCERLNYSSQRYIDNDLQLFLDDIAATDARQARKIIPRCETSNSNNSSSANELPLGLFGFELYSDINKYIYINDDVEPANSNDVNGIETYMLGEKYAPKHNSIFSVYKILTDKENNAIISITGVMFGWVDPLSSLKSPEWKPNYEEIPSSHKCTKEKELLVNNLSKLYSVKKDDFQNLFYKELDSEEMTYVDVSKIDYLKSVEGFQENGVKINKLELVLSIKCYYTPTNSKMTVNLTSKQMYEGIMRVYEKIKFIDFNMLKTDL